MKSTLPAYSRFARSTVPYVIVNGQIYSFAVNEQTREWLYADVRGVHLVSLLDNEVTRSIQYTELIKQELSRLSDRKQQEIIQSYASHGLQNLYSLHTLNIWLGVISRKRFIFFNEELLVSSESPIDISGVSSVKVDSDTGDIFTLTGEGKVLTWTCEILSDSTKKRSEFDVKIIQKKTFSLDSSIEKFDMSTKGTHYLAVLAENANNIITVHVWDYQTGEKLPSIPHTEGYNPVSVTAIGLKTAFLAYLDANKTIVVKDLETGSEIHRKNIANYVNQVDYIQFEETDLTSGIYLIENKGKIIDYSASFGSVLSSFSHFKSKEMDQKVSKFYLTGLRSNLFDDKASPGAVNSRFNTITAIITRVTGLKQVWYLYDGGIDVVDLAAVGEMVRGEGVVRANRMQGSEVMAVQMESGQLVMVNTLTEQQVACYPCPPSDSRGVSLCEVCAEMNTVVSLSSTGLLSCHNISDNTCSVGYQLSKLTVTALCVAPKYAVNHPLAKGNEVLYIVMGTDSGVILVFEYNPKGRGIDHRKRYAAHDAVVFIAYRHWDRKVITVGRDGYVKFLQCDNYYEWDSGSYKGFWADCSAGAHCSRSMVILGYESGMLQTLYFSPSADYPISGLLEYHTTSIRTVSGLDISPSEAVSVDAAGLVVLWNLEKNEPLRVFRVHSRIDSLVISGNLTCDQILVVFDGAILRLRNDKNSFYKRITRRDIQNYKAEIKRKRLDQKKKNIRSQRRLKVEPRVQINSVKELYAQVNALKQQLERDPTEEQRPPFPRSDDDLPPDKPQKPPTEERFKQMLQLIEEKRRERFKKSLTLTIRNVNVMVPREVLFHSRFQAKRIMITPLIHPQGKTVRAVTTAGTGKRGGQKTEGSAYDLDSLTSRFGFLSERFPASPKSLPLGNSRSREDL